MRTLKRKMTKKSVDDQQCSSCHLRRLEGLDWFIKGSAAGYTVCGLCLSAKTELPIPFICLKMITYSWILEC